jgi:hypothetical protein
MRLENMVILESILIFSSREEKWVTREEKWAVNNLFFTAPKFFRKNMRLQKTTILVSILIFLIFWPLRPRPVKKPFLFRKWSQKLCEPKYL